MIVRESISFQRYKDPKKALGFDVYDDFLKYRDKKMYVDHKWIWTKCEDWIFAIENDPDLDDETKLSWINRLKKRDIELANYRGPGDPVMKAELQASIDKMKTVKESIGFERYRDPKSALGFIKDKLLKHAERKVAEGDFSWLGLKDDHNFKKIDDWKWEIEFDPSIDRKTKEFWFDWLDSLKK